MKEYIGKIGNGSVLVRRISYIFSSQKERCSNTKCKSYGTYGAKGIRVLYSEREFIAWYLLEIEKFTGKRPSVGRIDHSGNYEFGNIRIEELSDNCRERMIRVVNPAKCKALVVEIIDRNSGEVIKTVLTTRAAAAITGDSKSGIHYQCTNSRMARRNRQPQYSTKYAYRYKDLP